MVSPFKELNAMFLKSMPFLSPGYCHQSLLSVLIILVIMTRRFGEDSFRLALRFLETIRVKKKLLTSLNCFLIDVQSWQTLKIYLILYALYRSNFSRYVNGLVEKMCHVVSSSQVLNFKHFEAINP